MDCVEYLLRAAVEGDAGARPYWSLLLDLYQLRGMQAEFERTALEYALGTGEQPPQWPPIIRTVIAPPTVEEKREVPRYEDGPEVVHLRGVMRGASDPQLRELDRFAENRWYVNINLGRVARMDLACATRFAARVNELARAGKTVRLLRPNGLVGALLASFELAPGVMVIKRTVS
jgi:ABC-type transporter Mla MlaB component